MNFWKVIPRPANIAETWPSTQQPIRTVTNHNFRYTKLALWNLTPGRKFWCVVLGPVLANSTLHSLQGNKRLCVKQRGSVKQCASGKQSSSGKWPSPKSILEWVAVYRICEGVYQCCNVYMLVHRAGQYTWAQTATPPPHTHTPPTPPLPPSHHTHCTTPTAPHNRKFSAGKYDKSVKEVTTATIQKDLLTLEEQEVMTKDGLCPTQLDPIIHLVTKPMNPLNL